MDGVRRDLGEALHGARAARGVSLRDLVKLEPELNRATVSRVERGERDASVETLAALARALDLTITIDAAGVAVVVRRRRRAVRAPS